jgi:hypothetical protein
MSSEEADDHEARKKSLATILSQNYGVEEECLIKAIVALGEGENRLVSMRLLSLSLAWHVFSPIHL